MTGINIYELRPNTLGGLKSLAKSIKRCEGGKLHEAQHKAARQCGFRDFHHALKSLRNIK